MQTRKPIAMSPSTDLFSCETMPLPRERECEGARAANRSTNRIDDHYDRRAQQLKEDSRETRSRRLGDGVGGLEFRVPLRAVQRSPTKEANCCRRGSATVGEPNGRRYLQRTMRPEPREQHPAQKAPPLADAPNETQRRTKCEGGLNKAGASGIVQVTLPHSPAWNCKR